MLGTGTSITVKKATSSQSGYLSNADWATFNSKVSSQWTSAGQNIFFNIGKVGLGTSSPVPSAALDISSVSSGVLLPRMTRSQRNAIDNPAEGLMVYCTNCGTNGSLSIFTGGSWLTFSPCLVSAPVEAVHERSQGQILWKWQPVAGAAGYRWNTIPDYESATDLQNSVSRLETGTTCNQTYSRYVWAYSSCGESSMSNLSAVVPAVHPVNPVAGNHSSTKTSVVWTWNQAAGAEGYKWSVTNDYATAVDVGTDTAKNETGLLCGTSYERYIWAYNGCGHSSVLPVVHSTADCWACGDSFAISHVQGNVAPVSKTVSYGTTTNLPGVPDKCWTTNNLGSSQQAASYDDNTEAAAGWYWQFNTMQGYQHDGSVRTPATPWNNDINENSDWVAGNDPCNLELGNGWRLPSFSEWYNLDETNGWVSATQTFDSPLKLHQAGYLDPNAGTLVARGGQGIYWSSTQQGSNSASYFDISYGTMMYVYWKSFGLSVRCLK